MIRRQGRGLFFIAALVFGLGIARSAHAQDLSGEVAALVGQNVDLRSNMKLRSDLLAHGLIAADAFTLHVTPDFVQKVFGVESFYNHTEVTRYHVGDRILIEDDGSGGSISPRAEITEVLPDGRYKVKIWDKPEALTHPSLWGSVDVFTGKPSSNGTPTKIKVHKPDGSVVEETSATPWLVHDNEREEILTHAQVEKLNGIVRPKASYSVNGWTIDPAHDPVLAERIEKAKAAAERILPASKLVLPEDPVARKAKLDEISKLQEQFLNEVFKTNFIEHPGNNAAANDRMSDFLSKNPDMRGKIGAVLASKCGVCTDQAAAMVAILNAVGERTGISALAIGGQTIAERAGHGFVSVKFANGQMGMYDVTWHFEHENQAVDNLDFATFDERRHSNRNIDWTSEETADPTAFVDPASAKGKDLERGYSRDAARAYLAGAAKDLASKDGIPLEDAASKTIASHERMAGVAGFGSADELVIHAAQAARAPSVGLTGPLDKMINDREHESTEHGAGER